MHQQSSRAHRHNHMPGCVGTTAPASLRTREPHLCSRCASVRADVAATYPSSASMISSCAWSTRSSALLRIVSKRSLATYITGTRGQSATVLLQIHANSHKCVLTPHPQAKGGIHTFCYQPAPVRPPPSLSPRQPAVLRRATDRADRPLPLWRPARTMCATCQAAKLADCGEG